MNDQARRWALSTEQQDAKFPKSRNKYSIAVNCPCGPSDGESHRVTRVVDWRPCHDQSVQAPARQKQCSGEEYHAEKALLQGDGGDAHDDWCRWILSRSDDGEQLGGHARGIVEVHVWVPWRPDPLERFVENGGRNDAMRSNLENRGYELLFVNMD